MISNKQLTQNLLSIQKIEEKTMISSERGELEREITSDIKKLLVVLECKRIILFDYNIYSHLF